MKVSPIPAIILALLSLSLPACKLHKEEETHEEHHRIVATSPIQKDITITQQYVCQIHSHLQIDIKALKTDGYLEAIQIKEGQSVKEGDVMFQIAPTLYNARLDAELAEVQLAEMEFKNAERLFNEKPPIVSQVEVGLFGAKLAKANAKLKLAKAELGFATIKAPFDGIIDRLNNQQGSLIKEGDILTSLYDNSLMWVHFNVPEVRYLEYRATPGQDIESKQVELVLANGSKFPQPCKLITPMGKVNPETGNFSYRADFPNPDRLLRHGQTGTIFVHRTLKNAIVIPQRATFEILDKRYVWVIGHDHVAHQREIVVQHELDDIFVVKSGLSVDDKFVIEGKLQVHEGQKLEEFDFEDPKEVLAKLKTPAQ